MPHYPGGGTRRSVLPTGALGGNALYELRLPHWSHLLGTVLPVHRCTLHKNGLDDTVTSSSILQQVFKQVAAIGTVGLLGLVGMVPEVLV
jgi:hypothetical protein